MNKIFDHERGAVGRTPGNQAVRAERLYRRISWVPVFSCPVTLACMLVYECWRSAGNSGILLAAWIFGLVVTVTFAFASTWALKPARTALNRIGFRMCPKCVCILEDTGRANRCPLCNRVFSRDELNHFWAKHHSDRDYD